MKYVCFYKILIYILAGMMVCLNFTVVGGFKDNALYVKTDFEDDVKHFIMDNGEGNLSSVEDKSYIDIDKIMVNITEDKLILNFSH